MKPDEPTAESDDLRALARGAARRAYDCALADDWYGAGHWGEELREIAGNNEHDLEIQIQLTTTASILIKLLREAGEWERLDHWGEVLIRLAQVFPQNLEIQRRLAQGACQAIRAYSLTVDLRKKKFDHWIDTLLEVVRANPEHPEIQLELSRASSIVIHSYGWISKAWSRVAQWGAEMQRVQRQNLQHVEIQSGILQGLVAIVQNYGMAKMFKDIEPWVDFLAEMLPAAPVTEMEYSNSWASCLSACWSDMEITRRLASTIINYWPGYHSKSVQPDLPICLSYAEMLSEQDRELHRVRFTRKSELAGQLRQVLLGATSMDWEEVVVLVAELWDLRMYLADRGDALVPVLEQFQMEEKLHQASTDPWRREKDW